MQIVLDSELNKRLEASVGVKISAAAVDDEQKQVILAGNDLTDIVNIREQTDILPMVQGEQILPLNDLIDKYGDNIKNIRPERLKMAQTLLSDGSGEAYVLPIYAGREDRAPKVSHSIYMTRWDYYKEMGYPKVETPDDMLALLKEMQEKHPVRGRETGVRRPSSPQLSTNDFDKRFHHLRLPYHQRTSSAYPTRRFNYTDPTGPFWRAAEYTTRRTAWGLDPDSLTQNNTDSPPRSPPGNPRPGCAFAAPEVSWTRIRRPSSASRPSRWKA